MTRSITSVPALLSLVFFLSGFTALAYQVAWQRLLTVHFGVGAVSITVIVSIFMAGLGLGALAGGRFADRARDLRAAYAGIEFLIGLFGLSSFWLLNALGGRTAGSSLPVAMLLMSGFLVVPTMLMGMTLPVLCKIYDAHARNFGMTVGQLYFVNTVGAATGSIATAYGLITFGGFDTALQWAAAINFALAVLVLATRQPSRAAVPAPRTDRQAPVPISPRTLRGVIVLTGFLAIGYELVWMRFIGILCKESPYAFATILSVYLAGLAAGSLWMSNRLARPVEPAAQARLLFGMQLLIALYVAGSFLLFFWTSGIPPFKSLQANSFAAWQHPPLAWPAGPDLVVAAKYLYVTADIALWPLYFAFFPAALMGATFPLVSKLALRGQGQEGSTVGTIYGWNILGNALGGLVTGFALLPLAGTERTLVLFVLAGTLFSFPYFRHSAKGRPGVRAALAVASMALVLAAAFPRKHELYAAIHPDFGNGFPVIEEGLEGIVFTHAVGDRVYNTINGVLHGGRPDDTFVLEAIETLSHAPGARRVLVIGYGTGEIADTLLLSKELEELVIVELNHALIANLGKLAYFERALADPRIRLYMDDGRRFLNRTAGKFDAVLMDPIYYHTAYSNNLYSRQFFQLVKARLAAAGVMMMWSNEHDVIPQTLASVFPYVRKHGGSVPGTHGFYLASASPLEADARRESDLLHALAPARRERLQESIAFWRTHSRDQRIDPAIAVNEDSKPRTEYYLGLRK